jgi:hypothetical protein
MRKLLAVSMVALLASAAFASVDVGGFESYTVGLLGTQGGFVSGNGVNGFAPEIVTSPALGGKSLRLRVGNIQADDFSQADIATNTPISATSLVSVEFDLYQEGAAHQNLWWWWWDNGTPTYGLSWDIGNVLPFGFADGAGSAPRINDQWAHVKMDWDFATGLGKSWYNGAAVDTAFPITGITTLTGWSFYLSHDAGDSPVGYTDTAYIDNLVVTPEPASLLALALAALALRRR